MMFKPRKMYLLQTLFVLGVCFMKSCADETTLFSEPIDSNDAASEDAADYFELQPEKFMYVLADPVQVKCKAYEVISLDVVCFSDPLPNRLVERKEISINGRAAIEITGTVTYSMVNEVFTTYSCHCLGTLTDNREIRTSSVKIKKTYLEKNFPSSPLVTYSKVSDLAQMACSKPDGKPAPYIEWEKDGALLDAPNSAGKFFINSYGNLIISNVAFSDGGNYTCIADNGYLRRKTSPAPLHVYENGGWSEWRPWSNCDCITRTMRRQRMCNSPAPRGVHANDCQGNRLQESGCASARICDPSQVGNVNRWTDWQEWGSCELSPHCQRHRYRDCPGSNTCLGLRKQALNCSASECQTAVIAGGVETDRPILDQDPQKIFLWVILCAAVAVLAVILVIIIMCLMRRKSQALSTSGTTDSEASNDGAGGSSRREEKFVNPHSPPAECVPMLETKGKMIHAVPGHQPAFILSPTSNNSNPALRFTHEPRSDYNRYMQISPTEPCDGHDYMQIGSTIDQRITETESSDGQDKVSQRSSSGPESGICNSTCGDDPQSLEQQDCSIFSNSVRTPLFLSSPVDFQGLRVKVPCTEISLIVPEGAIGRTVVNQQVFVGSLCDRNDRPALLEKQTMLSSVIFAGPQGVEFNKSVILSFDHCASLKPGQYEGAYSNWKLSIYASESDYDVEPEWKRVITLNQEILHSPIYCQLESNRCHLMVDQLASRYCLVGESMYGNKAVKSLRLAAFAQPLHNSNSQNYTVRVYILPDTLDTINNVIQEEARLGAVLITKTRQISFQDGGNSLCLVIDSITTGWSSKQPSQYLEIPFRHIWNGQSRLHCSLTFEQDRTAPISPFSCKIQVYQKSVLTNRQQLVLSSSNSLTESLGKELSSTITVNTQSSSGCSTMLTSDKTLDRHKQFKLSTTLKKKIASHLDTLCARGNDWRMFAAALNCDRQLNFFASKPSPSEALLDLWEAREGTDKSMSTSDLLNILNAMGRKDIIQTLENDISLDRVWV